MVDLVRGHPRFYELLDEARELHQRKGTDYATNEDPLKNMRGCEAFGVSAFTGCLVRMSDKWQRVQNLVNNGSAAVKDESLTDTLKDLAAYAYIGIILHGEERALPGSSAGPACTEPARTSTPIYPDWITFPERHTISAVQPPSVYISGPISGVADHNFPAFNGAATVWRECGYDVVNPAEFGADLGEGPEDWHKYMRRDVPLLLKCDEIYMLNGWRGSKGASLEKYVAEAVGMKVSYQGRAILGLIDHTEGADTW